MPNPKDEIWEAIQKSNRSWLGGNPRAAEPLFHEDVVMASPHGQPMVQGRDAMVQSFVDYCDRATTHEFQELDHDVHVFGDTAIVNYGFRVRYDLGEQEYAETARELLVFVRQEAGWRAVWRMQLPQPADG